MIMNHSNSKSNNLVISFSSGGFYLKGILHLPGTNHPPIVIGSHGLLATKNSPKQISLADTCNKLGIAYFRFDYRGCGESQGHYKRDTSFETRCEDLMNAVNTVRSRKDISDQIGLFGSSLGGAVSIEIAKTIHIDTLVTFAAPIRSKELSIPMEGSNVKPQISNNTHGINLQFDISKELPSVSNILIIHGGDDRVVPIAHAHQIYKAVNNPKKLVIQHKGDHAMSNGKLQKDFVLQAAQWLKEGLTK